MKRQKLLAAITDEANRHNIERATPAKVDAAGHPSVSRVRLAVVDVAVGRATHGGPVTGTGFLFPIPRKYGDPVGPTPVSPRPRKTPVNGGPVQTRTPVNGDGEPP